MQVNEVDREAFISASNPVYAVFAESVPDGQGLIERAMAGRVVEAFKPDFYLPEQDLYVEVTVMKQSLVTRKNRKIRKLRERYPDVKIKLFTRRDFERLAQKYKLNLAS